MRLALTRLALPIGVTLALGCTQSVTLGSAERVDAAVDTNAVRDGGTCGPDDVLIWGASACVRWVWEGTTCVIVRGCDCSGACTLAGDTYLSCMELHTRCWPHECSATRPCPTGYYCDRPSCSAALGTCAAVPTDGCVLATPAPTCGCDGITYGSPCAAALASQSIGACLDAGAP